MTKLTRLCRWMTASVLLCAIFSLASGAAYGEEIMYSAAREREGIVRSLDYANRIAIISGYKYSFGEPGANYYPEVTMYGSDFGSFELLQPGMKVRVVYGEFGFIRVVVRLEQLSDSAVIKEL